MQKRKAKEEMMENEEAKEVLKDHCYHIWIVSDSIVKCRTCDMTLEKYRQALSLTLRLFDEVEELRKKLDADLMAQKILELTDRIIELEKKLDRATVEGIKNIGFYEPYYSARETWDKWATRAAQALHDHIHKG